jgi:hypothetical protein
MASAIQSLDFAITALVLYGLGAKTAAHQE